MTIEEKKQLRNKIDEGIKAAIAEALERHKRLGQSIVVSRDGKIILMEVGTKNYDTKKFKKFLEEKAND